MYSLASRILGTSLGAAAHQRQLVTRGHALFQYPRTLLSRSNRNRMTGGSPGGGNGSGGGRPRATSGGSEPGDNSGLWGTYLRLLETNPFLTRTVTCALLNGLGDVFAQLVIEGGAFDAKRATTFTLLGLLFIGPILYVWYSLLGKLVPFSGLGGVLASLALDQVAFAPLFIASIMSVLTLVEGTPDLIRPKLEQDLVPAIKVNWMLWVPAQYINFKFVPPNLRVLAVNVVALIWNVYMSWQSHKVVVTK